MRSGKILGGSGGIEKGEMSMSKQQSLFSDAPDERHKPLPIEKRQVWKAQILGMNLAQLQCAYMFLLDGYGLTESLNLGESLEE